MKKITLVFLIVIFFSCKKTRFCACVTTLKDGTEFIETKRVLNSTRRDARSTCQNKSGTTSTGNPISCKLK